VVLVNGIGDEAPSEQWSSVEGKLPVARACAANRVRMRIAERRRV
jgi:hypothetical protein